MQAYDAANPAPINPYGSWPTAPACALAGYDAIMILGCPNNDDGTSAQCQQSRVNIALEFASAGYASRYIVSGAAVHNQWVEAETLRDLLIAAGVANSDIFMEPLAEHTDENIYRSSVIMADQGWTTALVVSDDPGHLLYNALCDSNCCVALGRLTPLEFPVGALWPLLPTKAAFYQLFPEATPVDQGECDSIRATSPLCIVTDSSGRRACADNFLLVD